MISALVLVLGMSVQAPPRDGIDYASYYTHGITFAEFLSNAQALADEWRDTYTHATIDEQALTRARALKGHWQLLVVADDSCHDSLSTVPYLARLSEAVPDTFAIRIVSSAAGQAVKDAHQTPDGRGATPTIVVLACTPDRLRATTLDVAGFGERLDEGVLLFDRPAVVAVTDGHGSEGD